MSASRKKSPKHIDDIGECISAAHTKHANGAQTAAYIEEMIREMETLANACGLDQLSNLLRRAYEEARSRAQDIKG